MPSRIDSNPLESTPALTKDKVSRRARHVDASGRALRALQHRVEEGSWELVGESAAVAVHGLLGNVRKYRPAHKTQPTQEIPEFESVNPDDIADTARSAALTTLEHVQGTDPRITHVAGMFAVTRAQEKVPSAPNQ